MCKVVYCGSKLSFLHQHDKFKPDVDEIRSSLRRLCQKCGKMYSSTKIRCNNHQCIVVKLKTIVDLDNEIDYQWFELINLWTCEIGTIWMLFLKMEIQNLSKRYVFVLNCCHRSPFIHCWCSDVTFTYLIRSSNRWNLDTLGITLRYLLSNWFHKG